MLIYPHTFGCLCELLFKAVVCTIYLLVLCPLVYLNFKNYCSLQATCVLPPYHPSALCQSIRCHAILFVCFTIHPYNTHSNDTLLKAATPAASATTTSSSAATPSASASASSRFRHLWLNSTLCMLWCIVYQEIV